VGHGARASAFAADRLVPPAPLAVLVVDRRAVRPASRDVVGHAACDHGQLRSAAPVSRGRAGATINRPSSWLCRISLCQQVRVLEVTLPALPQPVFDLGALEARQDAVLVGLVSAR
jgi:hypothetical protein